MNNVQDHMYVCLKANKRSIYLSIYHRLSPNGLLRKEVGLCPDAQRRGLMG